MQDHSTIAGLPEQPMAMLQRAMALHQRGDLSGAEQLYRRVLSGNKDQFEALHFLGVLESQRGRYEEARALIARSLELERGKAEAFSNYARVLMAMRSYEEVLAACGEALKLRPDLVEAWMHRGNALQALNRQEEALAAYERVLAVQPASADALHGRGASLLSLGDHAGAVRCFEKVVTARPQQATAFNSLGLGLHGLKRYEAALENYDRAIALQPGYADAWYNRGITLHALARYEDALSSYQQAIAMVPHHVGALTNCGVSLFALQRYEQALANQQAALAIDPLCAEAWINRAATLRMLHRPEEALESCDTLLSINPDHAQALALRGAVLLDLQRHDEALADVDRALALKPSEARALTTRGGVLMGLRRYDEALTALDRVLVIEPGDAQAHDNRGKLLMEVGHFDEAAASFRRALEIEPNRKWSLGHLVHARQQVCDWNGLEGLTEQLLTRLREGRELAVPFGLLAVAERPEDIFRATQLYVAEQCGRPPPLWHGERYAHDRIRLAYVSADLREHAVALLTAQLFERHDRSRFDVTAISLSADDGGPMRRRLVKAFDRFIDAERKSDREVAALLRELEVDIAVDLMTHTRDARPGIFALRPAPIQANYLGFAGTSGASFIDYLIGDRIVIPADHTQYYSEKIVYLPDSYLAQDSSRPISARGMMRREAGLPEGGLVFCCFNSAYKLTPPVFDIWMRLLRQAEGSVLWLSQLGDDAVRNLRQEARSRGVDRDRLIFAPRLDAQEDYLARLRLADLFLDTLPYNAHTTASDALWAGVPVVTCCGKGFPGRVAASLLQAVGLPELVTHSLEEYEVLALKLASDPALLGSIRNKLARNRATQPLFDTDRFCRHLEAAYATMWDIWQRGEAARSFAVERLA